jgi:hypothetical protein
MRLLSEMLDTGEPGAAFYLSIVAGALPSVRRNLSFQAVPISFAAAGSRQIAVFRG